ncbi:hypothetical protein J2Y69_001158 [Microbacterium resistens]|uniref:DUF3180 domain-containing protein n=1 Tax=Microbacterium resistens TaxID=156977 RepID=A0ABU1SAE7_9MICO|nr:DUF3180 domain-containing protein [Microbacterium resistens]MDR6866565.1 hypothetical protein [Microbacterium resistens]
MRRTSVIVLLIVALAGAGAGFLLDHALTISGRATFTPIVGLPILLVLLGAGVLILAWPIRRSMQQRGNGADRRRRVDPFRAFRVAILARASSLLGAVVAGFAAGLAVYLLTRPIAPPVGSMAAVIATLGGALALVAAALIAEHFCALPKDGGPHDTEGPQGSLGMEDDDDEHPAAAAGR